MVDLLDKQMIDMFPLEKALAVFLEWMSPFIESTESPTSNNKDNDEPNLCKPN